MTSREQRSRLGQLVAGIGTASIIIFAGCATHSEPLMVDQYPERAIAPPVGMERTDWVPPPDSEAAGASGAETGRQPQATASPETASTGKVRLRDGHPERYTVQRGDTLWGISGRFLRDPWLWPEVWQVNPEIANPHLIYPGDVIELAYDTNGQPRLRLHGGRPTVKLSPTVRVMPIRQAIPTIPIDKIRPFMERSLVLVDDDWSDMPYVLASPRTGMIMAAGENVYVRGLSDSQGFYNVFRPQRPYLDPDTGANLGTAGLFLGSARLESAGDPATLLLTKTAREVLENDRLFPAPSEVSADFIPRPASVDGRIISVLDGVTQIGQYQSVVLNRGVRDGVESGQVFAVRQAGAVVQDRNTGEAVRLPDEGAGLLMVYRVFDRVSYGLVVHATRTIHVMDNVGPPDAAAYL